MKVKIFSLRKRANHYLRKAGILGSLRFSSLFDKAWYLTNNPDVAQAKMEWQQVVKPCSFKLSRKTLQRTSCSCLRSMPHGIMRAIHFEVLYLEPNEPFCPFSSRLHHLGCMGQRFRPAALSG